MEELADTPAFRDHKENEFPHGATDPGAKLDRRELMKVMAASAAFAGLTGCTKLPTQQIVPYVRQPEQIVPGKPLFYATAVTLGGIATGVLVESHMARPTKVEGNPDHPGSLGRKRCLCPGFDLGTLPIRIGPRRKFMTGESEAGLHFRTNCRPRSERKKATTARV